MVASSGFSPREQRLIRDTALAFHESKHLPDMIREGRKPFARLIPSDYMGMCIVTEGPPRRYQWLNEAGAPNKLLSQYASLQPNDFVLQSVIRRRGSVLRDSEMISRRELVRSPLYQQSREMGMNLEQVMAVLLKIQPGVYCGITLYRDRRRAFTQREQARMQFLTRDFTVAIRNSHFIASPSTGEHLLEALRQRQNFEFIVLEPPSVERHRSPNATALIETWFPKVERTRSGLPRDWVEHLRRLVRMDTHARALNDTLEHTRDEETLLVTFMELPHPRSPRPWAILLHPLPESIPFPAKHVKELTPGELKVATAMLRNWDTDRVADELKLSRHTVKTHAKRIYKKLASDGHTDLMYQAARLLKQI